MMRASWVLAVSLVAALACGSNGSGGAGARGAAADSGSADAAPDAAGGACSADGGADAFPCDVGAIIEAKCQRCHNVASVIDQCEPAKSCLRAPFPLLVWSDTRREVAAGLRVIDRLEEVISTGFMPFQSKTVQPPVEKLTEAEKAILLDWVRSCGPRGTGACPP